MEGIAVSEAEQRSIIRRSKRFQSNALEKHKGAEGEEGFAVRLTDSVDELLAAEEPDGASPFTDTQRLSYLMEYMGFFDCAELGGLTPQDKWNAAVNLFLDPRWRDDTGKSFWLKNTEQR